VAGRFPLYTDADVHGPIVTGLVDRGWDVLRAVDAHPQGTDDEVHFETAANGRLHLRVRIGDAQPPGTYTGTVINSQTGDLCGTVTVKLT